MKKILWAVIPLAMLVSACGPSFDRVDNIPDGARNVSVKPIHNNAGERGALVYYTDADGQKCVIVNQYNDGIFAYWYNMFSACNTDVWPHFGMPSFPLSDLNPNGVK